MTLKIDAKFEEKLIFYFKNDKNLVKLIDAKFEEKLTCGLENDMRSMANFHWST